MGLRRKVNRGFAIRILDGSDRVASAIGWVMGLATAHREGVFFRRTEVRLPLINQGAPNGKAELHGEAGLPPVRQQLRRSSAPAGKATASAKQGSRR